MAPSSKPGSDGADENTPLLGAPETGISSTGSPNGLTVSNGNGAHKTDEDETSSQADRESQENADDDADEDEDKPMPYAQVLLLCYASLGEPVAYFAIFPFINEMIQRNGHLPESSVGFYGGLIESLFSLVQMVLMIFYGRLSDRIGRKPVLVFSLAGVSVATALFGMSQTLWQMILMRCLAGVFAGSVVTLRTMMSENTTKRTQGRAFSWYMFTRNLGIFIGPLVGGLANPAHEFPSLFGGIPFFEHYPYALSTFIAGCIVFSSALTTLFFVNETLVTKIHPTSKKTKPPMTTYQVLTSPGVPAVMGIMAFTFSLSLAYTAVSPVFMYTSVRLGGFAFSDQQIAYFLALAGISQSAWMLLAFPALQKRMGTGALMRRCCAVWPLFLVAYPLFNELLRHGLITAFWVLAPITLVLASSVAMSFACVQLFVNDIAPTSTVLGTVNALSLTVNSAVRAVAPVASTSLFAAGVKLQWADGHLVWVVLLAMSVGLNLSCFFIPAKVEGKVDKADCRDHVREREE